jgi:hypothetical protein
MQLMQISLGDFALAKANGAVHHDFADQDSGLAFPP